VLKRKPRNLRAILLQEGVHFAPTPTLSS
jgi:hypothetical protein